MGKPGLASLSRSEPGVFGSLEPEPLEKEPEPVGEKKSGAGAEAAWKKSQVPEPEPKKKLAGSPALLFSTDHVKMFSSKLNIWSY